MNLVSVRPPYSPEMAQDLYDLDPGDEIISSIWAKKTAGGHKVDTQLIMERVDDLAGTAARASRWCIGELAS